ncbi:DUF4360 domain-containing protein [Micromonosporaceae bacterium Da 78-11]
MLQVLTAGAMLFSSLTAPAAPVAHLASEPPPPDKMVISVVGANGSGCTEGTTSVTVSPDNTAFTLAYSNYMAEVGPAALPTDFRKNCQISLNVHVPQGFTYAIARTDYRGYGNLAPGATGYQQASYYFQGNSQTVRSRHNFAGRMDGDWQTTDEVGVASLSFMRCGEQRYLNINTELRVSPGQAAPGTTSFLTMDSTDSSLDTVYHVAWKRC